MKTASRRKVAILGGSFNPPTITHLQIASETLNLCAEIDEVWIVPCGDREDKKVTTPGPIRL